MTIPAGSDQPLDLFGRVSIADDGARNAYDYYPTPSWMTRSLLYHYPAIKGAVVLEPCAGDGAITRVLLDHGCIVGENDIDPRHERESTADATSALFWRSLPFRPEWVITNPPFAVAFPILQHAYEHAETGVAFLLRKTFLEPTDERGPWLQAHPPTRLVCLPRYSFRGTGSDSVSCDWMIWEKRIPVSPIVIDYLADRRGR